MRPRCGRLTYASLARWCFRHPWRGLAAWLVVLVAVVVGGMTLTLGLAFALGAQPVICHILAGHFLRQRLALGATVEIDGRRGQVENVGSVDTLLKDPERSWSVPNATLLDTVILR